MIDIANCLEYLGFEGWEVVNNEITTFPNDVKKPTQKQLEAAWVEVQAKQEQKRIAEERRMRYVNETDGLLFDALAKMDNPELKEWREARARIKRELPIEGVSA